VVGIHSDVGGAGERRCRMRTEHFLREGFLCYLHFGDVTGSCRLGTVVVRLGLLEKESRNYLGRCGIGTNGPNDNENMYAPAGSLPASLFTFHSDTLASRWGTDQ